MTGQIHLAAAIAAAGIAVLSCAGAQEQGRTFANPVTESGADPWVVRDGDSWVSCYARRNRLYIHRSRDLIEALQRNGREIWRPNRPAMPHSGIWAPELHRIGDRWYLYFAGDNGDNASHRMYVLESEGSDPAGPWKPPALLHLTPDRWAIDATTFTMPDGRRYLIWSGWEETENVAQNLYIAPMKSPVEAAGPRVRISQPDLPWEQHGLPIQEGPQILERNGRILLIYSASGSWTDHYCLGGELPFPTGH